MPESLKTVAENWRHKETGGIYTLLAEATGQAEVPGAFQSLEYANVVVYASAKDGSWWVRPRGEFMLKFDPIID